MLGGVAGYSTARWWPPRRHFDRIRSLAPVAQLDRVPGYEPGGRGFKSCRARQNQRVGPPPRGLRHFIRDFFGTSVPKSAATVRDTAANRVVGNANDSHLNRRGA